MLHLLKSPHAGNLAIVIGAVLALSLPFLGAAFNIDEPYFLAVAEKILRDPLHPMGFSFNWYGWSVPIRDINTYPLALPYLLALGLRWVGSEEWRLRLLMLPFDLAAAGGLYLLAARFLRRPLLPTLIVTASPIYLINMQHLMAEKWVAALGFPALYALLASPGRGRERWYWIAAGLLGTAMLFKYTAVFLVPVAIYCSWKRGDSSRRILFFSAAVLAPFAVYQLFEAYLGSASLEAMRKTASTAMNQPWSSWPSRLRAILACVGGGGVATMLWPWLTRDFTWRLAPGAAGDPGRRSAIWSAAALVPSILLFLPIFDSEPVRPSDRWAGLLMGTGAALGIVQLLRGGKPRRPGRELWIPWVLSLLFFQAFFYWSVVTRYLLFLLPPLVYALAARQESSWAEPRRRAVQFATLVITLILSVSLKSVDARHANAQRDVARLVQEKYIATGRAVRFTGHWGLQYYIEKAGAVGLDRNAGGWDIVKAGDIVVIPQANSSMMKPGRPVFSNVHVLRIDHPLPLRLIPCREGQAGFHSNVWGFLPYAFSRDPVDEFSILEIL